MSAFLSDDELDLICDESLRVAQEVRKRRGALAGYSPLMASSSITTYWSQATSGALPSETRGSDLWTSVRPGKKEIWSYMTYGTNMGDNKCVKIFLLETTAENKRRFVGPTFHQPQEAYHFLEHNNLAWPGDSSPLDVECILSEGLLKAWSKIHQEEYPKVREVKYETMGRGYFFPDQPPEDSDGTDMPDTPIHRRVYAFAKIFVTHAANEVTKYGFVRSRIKGDQYFVAVTPDYEYDEVEELKIYFAEDTNPYPQFDFDAKWMMRDLIRMMPDMT